VEASTPTSTAGFILNLVASSGTHIPAEIDFPAGVDLLSATPAGSSLYTAMRSNESTIYVTRFDSVVVPAITDIDKAVVSDYPIADVAFAGDGTNFCLAWVDVGVTGQRMMVQW